MVTAKIVGTKLVIEADIEHGTLSASQKNMTVATTSGFVSVPGSQPELRFSLNVIKRR